MIIFELVAQAVALAVVAFLIGVRIWVFLGE